MRRFWHEGAIVSATIPPMCPDACTPALGLDIQNAQKLCLSDQERVVTHAWFLRAMCHAKHVCFWRAVRFEIVLICTGIAPLLPKQR